MKRKFWVPIIFSFWMAAPVVSTGATANERPQVKDSLLFSLDSADLTMPAAPEKNQPDLIKGVICDQWGGTIPGAVISVKNKDANTISELDGSFSIAAKPGDQLIVQLIGFREEKVRVRGKAPLEIVLVDDVMALEGVVVTGYQKISRERAAGSYATISSEQLELKPVANVGEALQGVVPGMTMDKEGKFTIRGKANIGSYGDSNPLVVIDGFPVQSYESGVNPFDMVNPDDVENITVLKDAAATSIYGARAANGVIVVTTKKAQGDGHVAVSVDARVGVSSRYDLQHYFNFADGQSQIAYMERLEKYSTIFNSVDPYGNTSNPYYSLSELASLVYEYKRTKNITEQQYEAGKADLLSREGRWVDEYNKHFFRNAISQQYNFSMSGNSNSNNFKMSLLYNHLDGSSIGDNENRFLLNMADTYKLHKMFSIGLNLSLNYRRSAGNGLSLNSAASFTTPFTSLFNEDGSYANIVSSGTLYQPIYEQKFKGKTPASWEYNPLQDRSEHNNTNKNFGARVQATMDFHPLKSLNISLRGQFEHTRKDFKEETFKEAFEIRDLVNTFSTLDAATGKYVSSFPEGGMIRMYGSSCTAWNARAQIDYNDSFAEKHELTLMAIAEMSSSVLERDPGYTAYGYDKFTNLTETVPDFQGKYDTIFGTKKKYPYSGLGKLSIFSDRGMSMAFNMSYMYDKRYGITASVRTDASNFISDKMASRFSPFWSVGLVWNVDKEKFVRQVSWIDHLKLRTSYGLSGIAAGKKSISTLTTITTKPGNPDYTDNDPYAVVNLKGNPSLTWEKARTGNAGIDFSFFHAKLYGSLEYYNRYSYDVIAPAAVPIIVNSSESMVYNNAAILNEGIEMTLGSRFYITSRITWNGDFNFSWNRNTVKDYNAKIVKPGGNYVEGLPLSPIWAFKVTGYTEEGLMKIQGKDGAEVIVNSKESSHIDDVLAPGEGPADGNWLRYCGTAVAPYNLSFRNSFNIYGVTLSFQLTSSFGHKFVWADNESSLISATTKGFGHYLEGALANDASGYTNGSFTMPLFNEKNHEMLNAGGLYNYMFNLYNRAEKNVMSAATIRVSSVYVGWSLPARWLRKTAIGSCSIYGEVNNLPPLWVANSRKVDPLALPGTLKPLINCNFGLKLAF